MKNAKLKKILLSVLKLLYYIAIAFVCFIAAVLIYYIISVQIHAKDENYKPGISIYTIVSPSMTPNVNVYDVVVNIRVDDPTKINVGDIITFKSQAATSEGMTITHRVIARDQLPDGTYEYMTQGDNNPEPDSSYVMFDNVIGKEIITIPGLGKVQFLIANKKSWLFLLLIPIAIYLIKEIYKLIDLVGLKKKVTKVIEEPKEEPKIDHDKQELLKQQLKKELIEELNLGKDIEVKENKLLRPQNEKDGFLDKYSETVVKVEDKHKEVESTTKREVIAPSKPLKTEEKQKTIEEELSFELPKMKEYEVLKTDDLIIKEREYLEGTKIKVVNVEETKNKKKDKMTTKRKDDDNKISLDPRTMVPRKNPKLKVERPEGQDIKELRKNVVTNNQNDQPKKKKLKLNPNNVKKVNRNNNKKKQLNLNPKNVKKVNRNNNNNKKKQLNLNPKNVKKVNRYTKQKPHDDNKKKQPLIIIEKVK